MLIGVCGRRESGKTTIGEYLVARHGFAAFAFADALKDLAMAIGWDGEKDEHGRWLLQHLGMGCREVFGERCWINALVLSIGDAGGPPLDKPSSRLVVTDVRLPNEVDWIKSWGGLVVRVSRPAIRRDTPADQHATEAGIDALDADAEIVNDGALDELYAKVETVVANLKALEARG